MIRSRIFWAGSAVAALLSTHSLALAADYYFDSVAGNDNNDGKTETTAKATLKMPTGTGNTVYIKRGSAWTMSLNCSNVTVTTYGCGARPIINGSITVTSSTVEGLNAMPTTGNGFNVQSNSTVRDCEVNGSNGTSVSVGFGVNGQHNLITGCYVHDLSNTVSSGNMNTSGGAEGYMIMASNNEVSFSSAYDCQGPNATLGGFEGGCLEIVDGAAKAEITNVSFHHNYCEKSVGLFEASSGNFSGTDQIMDPANHGKINNINVSYNISVDSMWLFLLQPVNSDFQNVVFANNTIIHTPNSKTYWTTSSQSDTAGGHEMMGLAVATDSSTGTTYTAENQYYSNASGGFLTGSVIMRNNIFVDAVSSSTNFMFGCNVADQSNNIFVPSNANLSSLTLASTDKKVNLSDLAFTSDYRLTSASTTAIDQGTAISMSADATASFTAAEFSDAFVEDVNHHGVPCGAAPDIGASEFCQGAGGSAPWPGPSTDTCSTGGSASTGGTSSAATGGKSSTGAGGASVGTGGNAATGGAAAAAAGGVASTGGASAAGTGGSALALTGGTAGLPGTGGHSSLSVSGSTAIASTGGNAAAGAAATGGSSAAGTAEDVGSCACKVASGQRNGLSAALAALSLTTLALGRRRRASRRFLR